MKKPFSTTRAIITYVVCVASIVALCIGNYFAYTYKDLITVYTSGSGSVTTEESENLCQEIEKEGMVLLKNDGGLPLSEGAKVSIFGQDSVDFVYGGSGSGEMDSKSLITLKEAFEESGFKVNESLWDFYDSGAGKDYRKEVPDETGEGEFVVNEVPASVYTDDVKSSFKDYNDAAIVCIGRSGGESADLPTEPIESGYKYLEIDNNEIDMLNMACENFQNVVLVINANNPMELGFLEDSAYANVKSCIWVGGVGQTGIKAIPEAIVGNTNFSGHLADTYAYDSLSAPAIANFGDYDISNSVKGQDEDGNDVYDKYMVYSEGIYVGYRYYETRYEDAVMGTGNAGDYNYVSTVQFPFGYGLSYTDFKWSDYKVNETDTTFDISVNVSNTGKVAGKDVVEIYMQSPYTDYDKENKIEKSAVELVGFAKTREIEPGASETVTVSVDKENMKAYDANSAQTYIVDAGDYYFTAAADAHEAINNILAAKGYTTANGMDAEGNAVMTSKTTVDALDATTYAKASTGEAVTNQLADVNVQIYDESFTYLTRNDWMGTYPTTYQNGAWTANDAMLNDMKWDRSEEVINSNNEAPKWDVETDKNVSDAVGASYDDPVWMELVQNMSADRAMQLVRQGGYATLQVDSIGLPSTQDKDGPSGISASLVGGQSATAYPVEVVLASTWNVDLIEQMGQMVGQDSVNTGVAGWYAPGCNIHRTPYSGRNFEYFSEDGFLSGQMAGYEVKGTRSAGVLTYAKHFALNDQETNRYGGLIFANEQSIREIYLKGFEGAVRIGNTNGIMDAMSRVGARWAGAHKGLVTNILRNEWGFEGVVITDQASVAAMFYQDIISGLSAGTDLWLNTNSGYWDMSKYKEADESTMDWTSNATVMNNVQRAAKNVVYAVSTTHAMDNVSDDGTVKAAKPLWEIALVILDVVVVALCLFLIIRTLIAHVAYIKTLPKKEEEEGDDIVKKSKVVVIVVIAVVLSLIVGIGATKLIGGSNGSGSAAIQKVYVYGETVDNEYNGSNYNEYELTLYEDGTYKMTMTTATYAYSMVLGHTSVTTFGEYTLGSSKDGFTSCDITVANRIIYNSYSDVGGYNISYDTADEKISYPVELPGGAMTEKDDFWAMYGAARTALIDDGKTSQMKFAE
ncbi:MAG: glycoside hydrolase family 3 protein [Lachnospiraceae bacterium]|nr:glycoside hydrolase family 3 protein [Lachnospiraceae bacterium]